LAFAGDRHGYGALPRTGSAMILAAILLRATWKVRRDAHAVAPGSRAAFAQLAGGQMVLS